MVHLPRSWRSLLVLCALAAGCASANGSGPNTDDLAEPADMAQGDDLRQPPDLRDGPDLSGPVDLKPGPDLASITGCQIAPQSGCPAGMKCTTHDSATTICDPNGTGARGAQCTVAAGVDSCAAGSLCTDEGSGQSECRALCRTDTDCRDLKSYCFYSLMGAGGFKVCTQPCDPTYPGTGCAAGLSCVVINLDTVLSQERTDCQGPGLSLEGQRCDTARDCRGGMACVSAACHRVCRRGNSAVCAAGQTCVDVIAGGLYTWPTYGVCN